MARFSVLALALLASGCTHLRPPSQAAADRDYQPTDTTKEQAEFNQKLHDLYFPDLGNSPRR